MSESKRTELEETIEREKDRVATLQQELNAAQQHIATLTASELNVAELKKLLEQEKERSAYTTGKLEAALRRIDVLESRTESVPGTLVFQNYSPALFEPPIGTRHAGTEEVSIRADDQAKAEATTEPSAQGPGLVDNVQSQMQAPELTAPSDTLQKEHALRQRVAAPVRQHVVARSQRRKTYSQVRRVGSWTGYKGGYGNARGSPTINGPGIW